MRNLLFILSFLVSIFHIAHAGQYPNNNIEGVYYHRYIDDQIIVKQHRDEINIKGLRNDRGWLEFEYAGSGTFVGRRGMMLKIKESREGNVILIKYRDGKIEKYYKWNSNSSNSIPDRRNSCDDWGNSWNDDWEKEDYHEKQYDSYPPARPLNKIYKTYENFSIEGTYATADGKKIAIVETREGFRAKFSGDKAWKEYSLRNGVYIDPEENIYRIVKDGLEWTGNRSGQKIYIKKVSDVVEY